MDIAVNGKFVLDSEWNPPPPKAIERSADGAGFVPLGRGVKLRLGSHGNPLDDLLGSRIVTTPRFGGLGSVEGGCAVLCTSNSCREWARRSGRPRVVAKVIGVTADETRFVLLRQPKLIGAPRERRESHSSRAEAGLVSYVLIDDEEVECAMCPGHNVGAVHVS